MRHRLTIMTALSAALAVCTTAAREATEGISRFLAGALLWALKAAGDTFTWRLPVPRLALDGPALAYDAPPQHYLRHEAGRSRLAASRGI
jgi:hypothetical protein